LDAELVIYPSKNSEITLCFDPSYHIHVELLWKQLEPEKDLTPITISDSPVLMGNSATTLIKPTTFKVLIPSAKFFGSLRSGQYLFRFYWKNDDEYHLKAKPKSKHLTQLSVDGPLIFVDVNRTKAESIKVSIIDSLIPLKFNSYHPVNQDH
jgi:hypothetical protein